MPFEVIFWHRLCKWPRADCFLGTALFGREEKKKTEVFQGQSRLSLIFCPSCLPPPGSNHRKLLWLLHSNFCPEPHLLIRYMLPGDLSQDNIMKYIRFWFLLLFVLLYSNSSFLSFLCSLICLHSPPPPQSTVLTPWSTGVESCSSRMGQLHGVSFLTSTVIFNLWIKWMLQEALMGKKECWSQETWVPALALHLFTSCGLVKQIISFVWDLFLKLAVRV